MNAFKPCRRALVLYAHPNSDSFNAAIRDQVMAQLSNAGIETRLTDLYERAFQPTLTQAELANYLDIPANTGIVQSDVDDLRWADTLIFISQHGGTGCPRY